MTAIIDIYGQVLPALLACLIGLWLLSLHLRDASIIDIFWGPGFVLLNGLSLATVPGEVHDRQWLVHAAVTLWGLRLGVHLFVRNAGQGEDRRYRRWRERGGRFWWLASLYRVYLFQGLIMVTVALPVVLVNVPGPQPPLGLLDAIGLGLWLFGFLAETIADQQLTQFRRSPEGSRGVLDTGLWRYTAHPNYLGDVLQWWGLYLLAFNAPLGVWALASPLVMTLLLARLSGPLLERALQRTRPDYAAYLQRTARFFPRSPGSGQRGSDASGRGQD